MYNSKLNLDVATGNSQITKKGKKPKKCLALKTGI